MIATYTQTPALYTLLTVGTIRKLQGRLTNVVLVVVTIVVVVGGGEEPEEDDVNARVSDRDQVHPSHVQDICTVGWSWKS